MLDAEITDPFELSTGKYLSNGVMAVVFVSKSEEGKVGYRSR